MSSVRELPETERPETATVCVVGMGYVGLPLAVAFDDADQDVVGFDIDERKVSALNDGVDTTEGDLGDDRIRNCDVEFTTEATVIGDADYAIVAVPTPVDGQGTPNLDFVESAGETVGEYLAPGTTVVLESTVYPGATREVLVPAVERASGFTAGEDFHVGYSPERVVPGTDRTISDVVKIVGADDEDVRDDLADLYERVVAAGVYPAPSVEVAEAAKVVENTQRDLNIALMNELSVAFEHIGLDTDEVLDAAATKWNFHDGYRPGLVGGHCIPVDPNYLAYRTEREGFTPKLIEQARETNEHMPTHTAQLTLKALNDSGKVPRDSRLLVLGLTYKPNVADIRTSVISGVIDELRTYDAEVAGHDPHADSAAMRETFDVEVQDELDLEGFDGVILGVDHDAYDDLSLGDLAGALSDDPVLVDVPGRFDEAMAEKHGFTYKRL